MSNAYPAPIPPIPPPSQDGAADDDVPVVEVDGDEVVDPDANNDLIDSAEADRLAAGADD
ncbi:hypothetical protein [Microbacterium sp. NPDC055683]